MIKKIISEIWEKIKKYRAAIIMYLVMLAVSIVSDIFFGGFNILKYISYAVLLTIFIIIMIIYKDKIKETIDNLEDKIDSCINKQYLLDKGNNREELIYNLSNLQEEIKKDIVNNLDNINNPKIEVKITDEKN
ncbi:hypothetical protein Bint_0065 [Brachyspira intermedia PWS/A]|uniref:Uncharacterized protein n=1 Tax=Brachyspira intermedia (strain ATCC 51140 / PWS/A) TaxID=1045858 RepID=G0EP27_BRAIP|nr:hypothetical protein [Brachyspira intermedia]AEM20701.1 hypothetical protein Bint_0065 [Brachyspira intermedia PWS/A]